MGGAQIGAHLGRVPDWALYGVPVGLCEENRGLQRSAPPPKSKTKAPPAPTDPRDGTDAVWGARGLPTAPFRPGPNAAAPPPQPPLRHREGKKGAGQDGGGREEGGGDKMAARARGSMGSVGLEAGLAAELAGRGAAEPEVGRCSLWGRG